MPNKNYLPAFVFILLCLIWGSTWLFIKIGLDDAPPFLSAGLRFLIASLLLYPFMRMRGLKIPRDWRILSVMVYTGLFAVSVAYGIVYWSEQYISAGLTAVLFSTFPFFVIILSHYMITDDRLSSAKILGSVIGFSGVALIFIDSLKIENQLAMIGAIAVVIGAVFTAISNVVIKKNSKSLNPIVLTVVQLACGAVSLLLVGLLLEDIGDFKITVKSVGSLFYLAIMGSCIAFICYYWLISQVKVTKAVLLVFVIPIVAIFLDWLVLGQALNWRVFAGSGLVVGGVGIANR
jgi:drug/metabolite transporter (DMT)-like permease